jgi:DNA-binding MarR family transcriptional regulator
LLPETGGRIEAWHMTAHDLKAPDRQDGAPALPVCTFGRTRRLFRAVSRIHDAHLSAAGLTIEKYSLMVLIRAHQPVSSVALARLADIDPSTLSRNLQPLLRDGWVVQCEGTDRRCHSLSLSVAGMDKLALARQSWLAAQKQIERQLGRQPLVALHGLLEASATALRRD